MKLLYYPGCTVKRNAPEYERSSISILKKLGIEVYELERWYCCGVMFSLASDDLMKHLGAVRTLIKAQELSSKVGSSDLLTLCPMCFNVLRRVNNLLKTEPDKLETISMFMDEEERYRLGIKVYHVVEILSKHLDKVKNLVTRDLKNLNVAPYYGCTALRPKDIAIDNPEDPRIMDNLISATGATVIEYPFKSECCGSFQSLVNRDTVIDRCTILIDEAVARGAQLIVTICPLCHYNLKLTLREMKKAPRIGIIYFTELLAYSMGLEAEISEETKEFLQRLIPMKKV